MRDKLIRWGCLLAVFCYVLGMGLAIVAYLNGLGDKRIFNGLTLAIVGPFIAALLIGALLWSGDDE